MLEKVAMCPLRVFRVSLVSMVLLCTVSVAMADSYEQRIAVQNAEIEKAKRDLRRFQALQQEVIRNLDANSKKHVAEAMLSMFQMATLYNHLRDDVRDGTISEEEAVKRLAEFSQIPPGDKSLNDLFIAAIQKVKKGRLAKLDQLDAKIADALLRYQWARYQLRNIAREQRIESRGVTGEPEDYKVAQSRPLAIKVSQDFVNMEVGEIKEITLSIFGSKPPYHLRMNSLNGEFSGEVTLASRKPLPLPFSFATPGVRTVDIFVKDETNPGQRDSVALTFRVAEAEEEAPPPQESPKPPTGKQPQSQPPPPKPAQPPSTKPATVRPPLAPGVYRVHLRVPGYINIKQNASDRSNVLPIPFDITIDAGGNISGRCDYVAPLRKRTGDHEGWSEYWDTSFTISGKADWKSASIELSIPDGQILSYSEHDSFQIGNRIKYTAELKGWRVPGPIEPYLKKHYDHLTARFGHARVVGSWPIVAGPNDTYRIEGDGWYGSSSFPNVPPVSSTVSRTEYIFFTVDSHGKRSEQDWIDSNSEPQSIFHPSHRGKAIWSLKIVGRVSDDIRGLSGELVGSLGVWPVKPRAWPPTPIRIKVGDVVELAAYGVVAPRYFETTDLTNKAKWIAQGGVKKLGNGKFKATQAGTAFVRAGVKTAGEWSHGTVKIIIEPTPQSNSESR